MNYRIQYNIGRVKYTVSFHDGVKTHRDGSAFYDLHTFTNKRRMNAFITSLHSQGYREKSA